MNMIYIALNMLALIIFSMWYYKTQDLEPLAAIVLSIATLISLIWNNQSNTNKKNQSINSPVATKFKNQIINYNNADPEILNKLNELIKNPAGYKAVSPIAIPS